MTIRHFRIFKEVCDTGKFTQAANNLYIAQPAVSQAIKELEAYYGVTLFERLGKKIIITDEGKRLYNKVLHILGEYDDIKRDLSVEQAISVGATLSIGSMILPKIMDKSQLEFKNVMVENTHLIEKSLLDNSIDIALVEGIISNDSIISKKFYQDDLVLVGTKNAKKNTLLLREEGSGSRDIVKHYLEDKNLHFEKTWNISSNDTIIAFLKKGYGISFISKGLIENYLTQGELVIIDNHIIHRDLFYCYHKNKTITPLLEQFIKSL